MTKWAKTSFCTHFGPFWPKFKGQKTFSANFVALVAKQYWNELEYAKSSISNEAKWRKSSKTSFWAHFGTFWPKFKGQKTFSVNYVALVAKQYWNELAYAKSAISNEAKLRKSQKTPFWAQFGPKYPKFKGQNFFQPILLH